MKFWLFSFLVFGFTALGECPQGQSLKCETVQENTCGYEFQHSCDWEWAINPANGQYEYFYNCGYKNVWVCSLKPVEKCTCVKNTTGGTECTSSQWCIGPNEHCVNGQCVQKDPFNQCRTDFDCSLFDRCVAGVCTPKD